MKAIEIIQKIDRLKCRVVRIRDLAKLTNTYNDNTLYKIVERLIKNGILTRIAHGLYMQSDNTPESFEIANVLYAPSYVSLESALYRYGVIDQAPYIITSVTPRKTKKKTVFSHEYEYVHLNPNFFLDIYVIKISSLLFKKKHYLICCTSFQKRHGVLT